MSWFTGVFKYSKYVRWLSSGAKYFSFFCRGRQLSTSRNFNNFRRTYGLFPINSFHLFRISSRRKAQKIYNKSDTYAFHYYGALPNLHIHDHLSPIIFSVIAFIKCTGKSLFPRRFITSLYCALNALHSYYSLFVRLWPTQGINHLWGLNFFRWGSMRSQNSFFFSTMEARYCWRANCKQDGKLIKHTQFKRAIGRRMQVICMWIIANRYLGSWHFHLKYFHDAG